MVVSNEVNNPVETKKSNEVINNPKIDELSKIESELIEAIKKKEELEKKEKNEATKIELDKLKLKIAELNAKKEEITTGTKTSLNAEKEDLSKTKDSVKYQETSDEKNKQEAQSILLQFNKNPEEVVFSNVEGGVLGIVLSLLKAFFGGTWNFNENTGSVENNQDIQELDEKLEPLKNKPEKKLTSKEVKEKREKFIKEAKPIALEIQSEYGIPWEVTLGQAILESNYGQSQLSLKYNNYFGIKAFGSDNGVKFKTIENRNGKNQSEIHSFKTYSSMKDGFIGYAEFLTKNPRYKEAFKYGADINPKPDYYSYDYKGLNTYKFIYEISKAGYATDPKYPDKVASIYNNINV